MKRILDFSPPELSTISIAKPKPTVIITDSKPEDLITKESWTIFKMLEIEDKIPSWKEAMDQGKLENVSSYIQFCEFVEKMNVTNDCAERNIGLIQRYIESSRK